MKVKEAQKITGTMTRTSKMPGLSYSLPAWECQTGSKLRKVKGTPCYGCYALKGNYVRYPAIKKAQYYRLNSLVHDSWVTAMVAQIKRQKWFRWHDAGDVQSPEHMNKILEVVRQTPDTNHWLPTQERAYLPVPEDVPDNLVIRLSGSKIDGPAPTAWTHTSSVVTKNATCPAPSQGGKCKECRACWTKSISNVSYGKHWWPGTTQNIMLRFARRERSFRLQAPSTKLQATSNKNPGRNGRKSQAPSTKLQASSTKRI